MQKSLVSLLTEPACKHICSVRDQTPGIGVKLSPDPVQVVYNGSPSEAGVAPPRGSKARIVTLEEVQAAGELLFASFLS